MPGPIWRYEVVTFTFSRNNAEPIDIEFEQGSLALDRTGMGRDVLTFNIVNPRKGPGIIRLRKRDHVELILDDPDGGPTYEFRGLVWSLKENHYFEKTGIKQAITCVDYGKLSERVYINAPVPSDLLEVQMALAVANLAPHGISMSLDQGSPGTPLPAQLWEWFQVKQAFEMLASLSGWGIRWDGKTVEISDPLIIAAPFDIDDVDPNWVSLEISNSLDDYFNNLWYRYGPQGITPLTQRFEGNGSQTVWNLDETLVSLANFIAIDGLVHPHRAGDPPAGTSETIALTGGGGMWEYDTAANTLTQVVGATLAVGEYAEMTYNVQMPGAVFVADEAEYAEFGPWTTVLHDPSVSSRTEAEQRATALLQRLTGDDERVNVTTFRLGLSPFQQLTINVDDHDLDDDYMVLRTRMTHVERSSGGLHIFQTVAECVKGNQYRRNWEEFYRPNSRPLPAATSLQPVPPTDTAVYGCAASTGIIVHSDSWNSSVDPDDNWPDGSAVGTTAVNPTGGVSGTPAWDRNGDVTDTYLTKHFPFTYREGCCEFAFKGTAGNIAAAGGLVEMAWFNSFDVYVGGLSIDAENDLSGAMRGPAGLSVSLPVGTFSTTEFRTYRFEFRLSTFSGTYLTDGYLRFYSNGVLVASHAGTVESHWPDGRGMNGFEIHPGGITDNVTLRVLDATTGSASVSPSGSASPSAGNSSSVSPSASVSPTPSPSVSPTPSSSVSPTPSPSVSPSSSASRSVSPSSSPSSSASRSVSPSASVSPSSSSSPSAAAGFPAIIGHNAGADVSGTSHVISMPAGVSVGDLIVVALTSSGNPTISVGSGTGWTSLVQTAVGGNGARGAVYYKIADGSDALTIATSTAQTTCHRSFMADAGTFNASSPISATGFSFTATTNINPGSHTPGAGGTLNRLWIATYHGQVNTPTVAPSGYSDLRTRTNGTSNISVGIAEKESAATSDDPGAWTNANDNASAHVIAIEPV